MYFFEIQALRPVARLPPGGQNSQKMHFVVEIQAPLERNPTLGHEADEAEVVSSTAAQTHPTTRAGGQDDGS